MTLFPHITTDIREPIMAEITSFEIYSNFLPKIIARRKKNSRYLSPVHLGRQFVARPYMRTPL